MLSGKVLSEKDLNTICNSNNINKSHLLSLLNLYNSTSTFIPFEYNSNLNTI